MSIKTSSKCRQPGVESTGAAKNCTTKSETATKTALTTAVPKSTMTQYDDNFLSTVSPTTNATDSTAKFPVLVVCLIAGSSVLLIILLLVAIFSIKFRQRIRFVSKNNNTGANKNTNSTILPKPSYRQKNKSKPDDTHLEQTGTLQNHDYASLTHYCKLETGKSKSGPVYDQLEANEVTSKPTPSYFVLEPENQTQTRETNEKDVLSDEYDKLLRPQSPDSQGRDIKGSNNHSDYHPTVVTRNEYDHIDRNLKGGTEHHLNDNEYSTTTSKVINSDREYDRLDRSNDAGNKGFNGISSTSYSDVQLSKSDAGNGGGPQMNEISGGENPYEKTIIK